MGACAAGSGRNRRSAQHHGLRHRQRPRLVIRKQHKHLRRTHVGIGIGSRPQQNHLPVQAALRNFPFQPFQQRRIRLRTDAQPRKFHLARFERFRRFQHARITLFRPHVGDGDQVQPPHGIGKIFHRLRGLLFQPRAVEHIMNQRALANQERVSGLRSALRILGNKDIVSIAEERIEKRVGVKSV